MICSIFLFPKPTKISNISEERDWKRELIIYKGVTIREFNLVLFVFSLSHLFVTIVKLSANVSIQSLAFCVTFVKNLIQKVRGKVSSLFQSPLCRLFDTLSGLSLESLTNTFSILWLLLSVTVAFSQSLSKYGIYVFQMLIEKKSERRSRKWELILFEEFGVVLFCDSKQQQMDRQNNPRKEEVIDREFEREIL